MKHILAIGNSFSQDATHYLHQIAAADGVEFEVTNLYIGGCSLERHWTELQNGTQPYLLERNGASTHTYGSLPQALAMVPWDYIVTQQASHDSGKPETYRPYLAELAAYVRAACPGAELLLQQTWAYESDSLHPAFQDYHHSQQEMYERLRSAYADAACSIGARLIPCGDVIQTLRTKKPFLYGHGGMSICRDGFHMNVIYGRYLLSAVWYKTLTGRGIRENPYLPQTPLAPNAVCDAAVLDVVKETVDSSF